LKEKYFIYSEIKDGSIRSLAKNVCFLFGSKGSADENSQPSRSYGSMLILG
jgi:hypothetical protein